MTGRFDEIVHAPNRLRICALLAASSSAEFGMLRDVLGVADSVLSKHLKVLQEAGYLTISKPTGRGRVRTWVRLTPEGRRAYADHVEALKALFDTPAEATSPAGSSPEPGRRR
ncbi:transcriptional regulator [Nonomuraea sp. NPDC049421]|uniref:transcriptional regulator n=1 Tax=Nonomuraea sp. NPDC049421 TaxID=3155275 RepID=UPI0034174E17